MSDCTNTIIIRHRKENLKKCSLRGLEIRQDMTFYTYPNTNIDQDLSNYILLTMDAPPLTEKDKDKGLLLIDGTWRYAEKMLENIPELEQCSKRSLPNCYRTAYPRKQTECPDPETGLASIEALYIAYLICKKNPDGLLDHYHWRNNFLDINNIH